MTRARRSTVQLLQLMLVCSVALPAVLFAYASWLGYRNTSLAADERVDRLLDVLHEHALKVFQSVELAITAVDEVTRGLTDAQIHADQERLHQRIHEIIAGLSPVQSIWLFAANGRALVSSSVFPVPASISNADRDYFQAQLSPVAGSYIGEVVAPRLGHDPIFTVSRRRSLPNGWFNGVTAAALLPKDFYRLYAEVGRADGAYFALMRADGAFLVRYPAAAQPAARLDERSVIRQTIVDAPEHGIFNAVSQLDGVERRIGYRRLGAYPLYVMAGTETRAIADEWWRQMASHLVFGLPATALLFAFIGLALHRTHRLYAEAERREAAEEALRQSQKMEAVGQLTGGVAHDFNNLLTVVMGNLDLAQRALEKKGEDARERLRRTIANAVRGAERAATLTQRLLAFSRRQPLEPKPLDANKLLSGMSDLLNRALGETVQIEVVAAAGLWQAEADPAQLEAAILNLALNARDAMPEGGKLTIETCNVFLDENYCRKVADLKPGQYVMIAVSDTGSGMTKKVLERAFEPFFTTKSAGHGTGLGLSQVYGFVRQSGGHVKIYSEVGQGSSVKIYLPRLTRAVAAPTEEAPIVADQSRGETILVVEDDAEVRAYVGEVLRDLDYQVLEAADAEAALTLLQQHAGTVDLLLTDVVLPGMNGRQLAAEAVGRRADLRVLFMTGYSRNAIVHQGKLDADVELIQKPLTAATLAARIRALLDQAPPSLVRRTGAR
jgi:two-component system NtrC family sensor kinase